MAEGWAKQLWPGLNVFSAGSEPAARVDPMAVEAMAEKLILISTNSPKSIETLKIQFDLVVALCEDGAQKCPYFTSKASNVRLQSFDDPPALAVDAKTDEEVMVHYRRIRDEIGNFVANLPLLYPELFEGNAQLE